MSSVLRLTCISAAVSLLFSLAGCGEKPAAAQTGNMPPPEVSVITIAPKSVTLSTDLPGRLQATRSAQVRARVEGIVLKRVFTEGSDVKAGTLLFQIDPTPLKANLETAQAGLSRAEADAFQASAKAERYQPLLASNAVSKQEYDEAVARAKQTQADVASAKATLTKARLDLDYANVSAPISGHIGRAQVTEGALVGKGEATPLATIEQVDPIYVNFTQSSVDFSRIKRAIDSGKLKGANAQKANMKLLLEDGSEYPDGGQLLFSDLAVDPSTGEISLRAKFPNAAHNLLPGMYVRVRYEQAIADNAITVPQRAVIRSPQGAVVMLVAADGKVAAQPVKLGQAQGDQWIVTEGLKGGEQVIIEGLQKVKPGGAAKAVPFNSAGPAPAVASAPSASAPPK